MRRIITVLTVICMTVVFLLSASIHPAKAAVYNLVPNASFELKAFNQEIPESWMASNPASTTLKYTTVTRHTGMASANIYSSDANAYPNFHCYIDNVRPGQKFQASAWAKISDVTGEGGYIAINFWDNDTGSSKGYFVSNYTGTGTVDWQQLNVTATAPDGTDRIIFSINMHGTGDVYFDDVLVIRLDGNIAPNPGFESGTSQPDNWLRYNPAGTVLQRQTDTYRTGIASAQIYASDGSDYPNFYYDVTNITPGQTFTATVWAKTANATDTGGYIALSFWQDSTKLQDDTGTSTGPGTEDWQQLTVTGTAPAGANKVRLGLVFHGTGNVYFDDAVFDLKIETVDNPFFTVSGSPIACWTTQNPGNTVFNRDTTIYRTWPASANMVIPSADALQYPAFKQTYSGCLPGEVYQATVYAKTSDSGKAAIAFNWMGKVPEIDWYGYDDIRRLSCTSSSLIQNSNWTQITVTGVVPNGADSFEIALVGNGQGTVYFDDVTLTRTSAHYTGSTATLTAQPSSVITNYFYGFGSHGEYFLTCPFNIDHTQSYTDWDGQTYYFKDWLGNNGEYEVNDSDRQLWKDKTAAIKPHIMRIFFNYDWWEHTQDVYDTALTTPDLKDMVDWITYLKSIGTDVLICPWGDWWGYPEWMREPGWQTDPSKRVRLPAAQYRDDMIISLVDFIDFLRNTKGLTNVKYLTLMNEPNMDYNHLVSASDLDSLNNDLVTKLTAKGLRSAIHLVGIDDSYHSPQGGGERTINNGGYLLDQIVDLGLGWLDSISVHTYMHQNTGWLDPFIKYDFDYQQSKGITPKPYWITEFGYGGSTFGSTENGKYEYGLWMADFTITALKNKAASLINFYYGAQYLDRVGNEQKWGLWKNKRDNWVNRPGFYSWSLINRYTKPGSQVISVDVSNNTSYKLDSVAFKAPDGKLTMFIINRSGNDMTATIYPNLGRSGTFNSYKYTHTSVPTNSNTATLIGSSGSVNVPSGGSTNVTVPYESFVVFTEIQ